MQARDYTQLHATGHLYFDYIGVGLYAEYSESQRNSPPWLLEALGAWRNSNGRPPSASTPGRY